MPEIPVPMFAVVVNKIHNDIRVITAEEDRVGRCTLTSAINVELEPNERTRVNRSIHNVTLWYYGFSGNHRRVKQKGVATVRPPN